MHKNDKERILTIMLAVILNIYHIINHVIISSYN